MKHIIIGLGGAGGRIIRALRKSILRDYPDGGGHPIRLLQDGVEERDASIGFLYVDSNENELKGRDGWSHLGRSVLLEDNERLLIRDGNLGGALDGFMMNPAISRWLGAKEELQRIFRATAGVPGANQIRRWGRFLFANSAAAFRARVVQRVNAAGAAGGAARTTFHICCTLAGGTGSGSIVDAIMQIRKEFPTGQGVDYPIYLYCMVTDAPSGAATGNFYANQYAALLELNAMVSMNWSPHDVSGDGQRMDGVKDRFVMCNLISDKNLAGQVIPLERQEELIAEYLYHRTIVWPPEMGGEFHKAHTLEDVIQYPGEPFPDVQRSYFFGSIGVKRWSVPVDDIEEKFAHECAAIACRQMLYNRWEDDLGYVASVRERDIEKLINDRMAADRWRLSDDQTLLRTGFELQAIENSAISWEDDWSRRIHAERVNLEDGSTKAEIGAWLLTMRQNIERMQVEGFRENLGIEPWFNQRLSAVKDYAERSADLIEKDMWSEWRLGELGLADIHRILDMLIHKLSARMEEAREHMGESQRGIREAEARWKSLTTNWPKPGWLSNAFLGARTKLLNSAERVLHRIAIARTSTAAFAFQDRLLGEVRSRVAALVTGVSGAFTEALHITGEMDAHAAQLCPEGGQRRFDDLVVQDYDPRLIAAHSVRMRQSLTLQRTLAQDCRDAMEQRTRPDPGFAQLHRALTGKQPREVILEKSVFTANNGHSQSVASGALEPVLGISIIAKLEQRYRNQDVELRRDIELFMSRAATACLQDGAQQQPSVIIGNANLPHMALQRTLVSLPEGNAGTSPFAQQVVERFQNVGNPAFAEARRSVEITALSASYWMAARFFHVVRGLKTRYDSRRGSQPDVADREIHLEDHSCPLPDIFVESGMVVVREGRALALVGRTLGCLVPRSVQGREEWHWEKRDSSGMTLGSRRVVEHYDHFASLPLPDLYRLSEDVSGHVRSEWEKAGRNVEYPRQLETKLQEELAAVWNQCGVTTEDRNTHPRFQELQPVVERAKRIVHEKCR